MSEEYTPIVFKQIAYGVATVCTLDEKNPHLLYIAKCNGFKKGDEIYVFCEKHRDYVKLEKAEEEETSSQFTGGFVGDGIVRECGAVGHGCDDCYIKCDVNPQTQEEDDERFIMEDLNYNPYEER